jgi:hypothetical protein
MKVKCISTASGESANALHYRFLTVGEIYEVESINEHGYLLIADNNIQSQFRKESFITIQQLRDNKLNQILDEF